MTALSGVPADKKKGKTGQGVSTANFFRNPNPNPNQLLPTLFSSAALFESTAADNFQERTGQGRSAVIFFLAPERQFKKEAAIAHGVCGPSRSNHLLGVSLPTSKDFQGKTGQGGSAANFLFFSAQECQHKKEAHIAHGIHGPSRSYHLAGASSPTPEGLIGPDASADQDASAAGFAGPPYNCESDENPRPRTDPKILWTLPTGHRRQAQRRINKDDLETTRLQVWAPQNQHCSKPWRPLQSGAKLAQDAETAVQGCARTMALWQQPDLPLESRGACPTTKQGPRSRASRAPRL